MRAVAILLLAGLPRAAAAQPTPDTTSAWRYVTLEIGNVWEYERWEHPAGKPDRFLGHLRWGVEADSVVGGVSHSVVREQIYDAAGELLEDQRLLVRFDADSSIFVARYPSGAEERWPLGFPCRLDASFYSIPECVSLPWQKWFVEGGYGLQVVIGQDTTITTVKWFGFDSNSYQFAADVGLVFHTAGAQVFYHSWPLQYARVGGVEYGEPTGVSVEAGPEEALLTLAAYPNPSSGPVTVAFELPAASAVTLAVYDLLGREVVRLVDAPRAAGGHHVRFEVGGLPAGVYVVQLEAAGEVHARTMAVVR